MKTTFISSHASSQAVRYQLMRMQAELVKVEKEVVSGRVADAGLHLGARSGQSFSLERDIGRLKGIIDSNGLLSSRLEATQVGMQEISDTAQTFLSNMTAAASGSVQPEIALAEARKTIIGMAGVLNSSMNGENIFAGINTDVTPFEDFFADGSAARTAMEDAFQTHFGFAHTDPEANDILPDEFTDFLDNVIEPQFMGAGWSNWSNATDETITARITLSDTTNASVSANIEGVRRLAMSAATVAVFFEGPLNESARTAVLQHSASQAGQSAALIAQVQAETGIVEQRVTTASERLSMQVDIFENKNSDLVGVDPYDASTRVSNLLAQIETAYTLTSRIRQLSLVRFMP